MHEKNIIKKSTYIILVPSQRYQDFWQLLQNQKVPKIVLGFSNHAQRFTQPYYLDVDNPFHQTLNVTKIEMSLKIKCHQKCSVTETEMLPKLKCHLHWIVATAEMSLTVIRHQIWNVTKTAISPKLKYHQNWNVTKT